jgi:hypothetical protein
MIFVLPPAFSQKRHMEGTGIKYFVTAGVNIQNLYGTDFWGEKLNNEFKPGFHAGAGISLPIGPDLSFSPGLIFHNKGAKQDTVAGSIKTANLYYFELPVSIMYRPQMGDGHLLFGFGPYAGYGVAGKEKIKTGDETDNLTVRFKNNVASEPTTYAYYRGLDAGAGIFFGYELYSGMFFQVDAQMGLIKINPNYDLPNDKTSKKNVGFGFSAGFRF